MSFKYYSGIGSRKTPEDICSLMTKIAKYLYKEDYILRSGGAEGADTAFELGAGDKKEIFLPWKGFNNSKNKFIEIPKKAYEIASEFHPVWNTLKDYVKALHARNSLQVLGKDLNTLSDFIICWTKNGSMIGGTAQALRIAKAYDIPIFNLAIEKDKERILKKIEE